MNADIGFMLMCSALVFIMTPGLACFYGGLVRKKNTVNTMMTSIFIIGTGIVMWVLFGYSLSFAPSDNGIIGDFSWLGLNGVSLEEGYTDGASIPNMVFCIFQMMFAIITPALITGSVAGRMKFKSLFLFIILWSIVVYYPLAHMVWAQGGILGPDGIGALDFAGGDVVHISSGVSALVLCKLLGKRRDYDHAAYRLHNIPTVMIGASLLMFGWFGFNAGSALSANGQAVHAFMTTAASAGAALLSWMVCDIIKNDKPTLIGACTGIVAGLVGITPSAGFVPVWAAVIIGLTTSPICFIMISYGKKKFGFDDALDAFSCHGTGGIWGGLMTGIFAQASIGGKDGAVFGNWSQFGAQVLGIVITAAVAVAGTLLCYGLTRLAVGKLRVEAKDELIGLDISQHGETAYPSFNGLE
ncbi:MAG: ammonium transporter [Oscillospiraceae bacterium]|nr:ammonium transporter [Oscillospiraceae bacterium]